MSAGDSQTNENSHLQLATFSVGSLFFGVNVHEVQEVLREQELTRVPLASEVIQGLINLRGQILPAIDMRKRLNISCNKQVDDPMNVIVNTNHEVVSLLVDSVGDVIEVDSDQFEPTPASLTSIIRDHVHGVYKLDGKLLLLLNAPRIIELKSAIEREETP